MVLAPLASWPATKWSLSPACCRRHFEQARLRRGLSCSLSRETPGNLHRDSRWAPSLSSVPWLSIPLVLKAAALQKPEESLDDDVRPVPGRGHCSAHHCVAFRYGNRKRNRWTQIRLDPFLHMSTVWASGACGRPVISDMVMRF